MDTLTQTRETTCRLCGQQIAVPVLTGYARAYNGVDGVCAACEPVLAEREQHKRHIERIESRITELVALGDYSDATRRCWFKRSNPAVEAKNPQAWQAVRAWKRDTNLYLYGPPGTGKSHAARCILNRCITQNLKVAEVSSRRVFKADRLFNDHGAFRRWQSVDVLLLDDLDKAHWTEDALGALWELVDARCSNDVRTICTGNVTWRNLGEILRAGSTRNSSLASSIGSRISPVEIRFDGDDLRRRLS
jgi:DNA replication protein DnaC